MHQAQRENRLVVEGEIIHQEHQVEVQKVEAQKEVRKVVKSNQLFFEIRMGKSVRILILIIP